MIREGIVYFSHKTYVFIKILATLPFVFSGFLFLSIWHNKSFDTRRIHKRRTPVLLIHGSHANQQQWFLFRQFLQNSEIGHVFTVNLNKRARKNDGDKDMEDYAVIVHNKLQEMQQRYKNAHIDMKNVILVGNSMGGLVAGAYCVKDFENKVPVKALITISTPWNGSLVANYFCNRHLIPEKYFCTESIDRKSLVEKVLDKYRKNELVIYNYGSSMDWLVPPYYSELHELNKENTHVDDRNDHWTVMADRKVAHYIRRNWIVPNTEIFDYDLSQFRLREQHDIDEETVQETVQETEEYTVHKCKPRSGNFIENDEL